MKQCRQTNMLKCYRKEKEINYKNIERERPSLTTAHIVISGHISRLQIHYKSLM